jgi:hypothetical protein
MKTRKGVDENPKRDPRKPERGSMKTQKGVDENPERGR